MNHASKESASFLSFSFDVDIVELTCVFDLISQKLLVRFFPADSIIENQPFSDNEFLRFALIVVVFVSFSVDLSNI